MIVRKTIIPLLLILFLAAFSYAESEGGGDIRFESVTAGPVFFSHDYHTKIRGIRCMACHFRMFEAVGGGYKMNREKLNKRDFCGYCHNGMKGFDLAVAGNCSRCHKK